MSYFELPETLVSAINMVTNREHRHPEMLSDCRSYLTRTLEALAPLAKTSEAVFANSVYLANQFLRQFAEGFSADALLTTAYAFDGELRKLRREQLSQRSVLIPELNELLLGGRAVLSGRARPSSLVALLRRGARARIRLERRARMLTVIGAVRPETKVKLRADIIALKRGIMMVHQGNFARGLDLVQAAARALAPLEAGPRRTPVVGLPKDLGHLLKYLARRSPSEAAVQEFFNGWSEDLIDTWEEIREHLLIDPSRYDQVVAAVDNAVLHLTSSEGMSAESLQRGVEQFLASWEGMLSHRLSLDQVWGTSLEPLAHALLGVWHGRVPDRVLAELTASLRSLGKSSKVVQLIRQYLQTGQVLYLLLAMEAINGVANTLHLPETFLKDRCCTRCQDRFKSFSYDCLGNEAHRYVNVCA